MNIPRALVATFPPSNQLLLDVTRRQIDDEMLEEISWADYGHKADAYLSGLRSIRDQGIIPRSMGWDRAEVLELIRWSDPENPAHKPGSPGRRGHQMRAFACAVLLRAAADEGGSDSDEATLAQSLGSANVLGDELNSAVASFLTWRIPSITCIDRWLCALGLLVVANRFRERRVAEQALGDAATWVLEEESEFRRTFRPRFNPADPPPAAFGLTYGFWKPLFAELVKNAADLQPIDVRRNLEMIGTIFSEES
jgi:hypothetical protein